MLPELLSPAGSLDAALAAFASGADAVYTGMPRFSARADAVNISSEGLELLLAHARATGKKVYVTLNTVIHETEREALLQTLAELERLHPNALIVQDLGVARLVRKHFPSLELHASTQLAAHNEAGVRELAALGFTRVVLARECTLAEAAAIRRNTGVEIEYFVHGALCYSISGLCLFSAMTQGRSGNRGRCAYCCRAPRDGALPYSMRSLVLAPVIDQVREAGLDSLKIEGRMKSPLYVSCVTDYYRKLLDDKLTPAAEEELRADLMSVFSRTHTTLYAEGEHDDPTKIIDAESLGHRGTPVGRVERITPPDAHGQRYVVFKTTRALERHDGLQFKLPGYMATFGGHPYGFPINELRVFPDGHTDWQAPAAARVAVALPSRDDTPEIPVGETVYQASSQAVRRRYPVPTLRPADLDIGRAARFDVKIVADGVHVHACDAVPSFAAEVAADVVLEEPLTPSRKDPASIAAAAREAFTKLGDTAWHTSAEDVAVENADGLFVPKSLLNEARRRAVEALDAAWAARAARRHAALMNEAEQQHANAEPLKFGSVKYRLDQTPVAAPADTRLVLGLSLAPTAQQLARYDAWCAVQSSGAAKPALAMPVWTRDEQWPALEETVRAFLARSVSDWEVSSLAAIRLLRECGVKNFTADGFLPVANVDALDTLRELGVTHFVASAETPSDVLAALDARRPGFVERLAYQRVPLFISCTAPVGGGTASVRRFGGSPPVVSYMLPDSGPHPLWITLADTAPFADPAAATRTARADHSWDEP